MSKEVLVIGGSGDIGSSIATLFSDNCIVKSTSRDELDLSSDKSIKSFLSLNKKNLIMLFSALLVITYAHLRMQIILRSSKV